MALALTGATSDYAPSSATIKTAAAQESPNYDGNATPYYHFTDADNRPASLRQSGPYDGPVVAANGPSGSTTVLEFVAGGQQGESLLRLTQQNCVDLVSAIVAFANTGTLS
jgi:hypothetical protein